jgi:hypothetical protein
MPFRYRLLDTEGDDLGPFVSSHNNWHAGATLPSNARNELQVTAVVEPEDGATFAAYLVVKAVSRHLTVQSTAQVSCALRVAPTDMGSPSLPVPYEKLLEQIEGSYRLQMELRRREQTPKVQESIRLLEAARLRMFEALRSPP